MLLTTLVIMLALIQYFVFGLLVGRARGQTGVEAPAVTGHPDFERVFRAHQNTLEQLVMFVPAAAACAWFMNDLLAAGLGVVYLIGRTMYFIAYSAEASKRGAGMGITALANLGLVISTLVGVFLAF